jgi:hypothetical protein
MPALSVVEGPLLLVWVSEIVALSFSKVSYSHQSFTHSSKNGLSGAPFVYRVA